MRILLAIIAIAVSSCGKNSKPSKPIVEYPVKLNAVLDKKYTFGRDYEFVGAFRNGELSDNYKLLSQTNYAVGSSYQGVTNPTTQKTFTIPHAKGGYQYSLFQGSNGGLLIAFYVKDSSVNYPDEKPTVIPKEKTKDAVLTGIDRNTWTIVPNKNLILPDR